MDYSFFKNRFAQFMPNDHVQAPNPGVPGQIARDISPPPQTNPTGDVRNPGAYPFQTMSPLVSKPPPDPKAAIAGTTGNTDQSRSLQSLIGQYFASLLGGR